MNVVPLSLVGISYLLGGAILLYDMTCNPKTLVFAAGVKIGDHILTNTHNLTVQEKYALAKRYGRYARTGKKAVEVGMEIISPSATLDRMVWIVQLLCGLAAIVITRVQKATTVIKKKN